MRLNEYRQDLTEEGLIQAYGVIVDYISEKESIEFAYVVFLEDAVAFPDRFVFVSRAAFENVGECSGSKSEKARLAEKENLYCVCDPVAVWLRPGSNICDKMIRGSGSSNISSNEGNLQYRTKVVLSPAGENGLIRCFALGFGEVAIRTEDQDRFREYFANVAYYGDVEMHTRICGLSSLVDNPSVTAEFFLASITDTDYNYVSSVVTAEVNPGVRTYNAQTIQKSICRLAPWNANITSIDLTFYGGDGISMVADFNPHKCLEIVGQDTKAVVLDKECRTAFCRRFPDNLVLLADVQRNNFEQGEWIAARFFYSPICKEWVALSYRPLPGYKRIETGKPDGEDFDADGEDFDAFKLEVCRSEVAVSKNGQKCPFAGLVVCPMMSVLDVSNVVWGFVDDPCEIFGRLNQNRATVWVRFMGVGQPAKFAVVALEEDAILPDHPSKVSGEGIYLGGEYRLIYATNHPSWSIFTPALFADMIKPGDRVKFFAVWNEQTDEQTNERLGTYVAIRVEKKTHEAPMKVFLSEHGPTIRVTARRVNERGFYHADLGLIADPKRKISLKNRKLPASHDDNETVYVTMDHEAKPIPRLTVVSRQRPRELVMEARWMAQVDRATVSDATLATQLVTQLGNVGNFLSGSSQNRQSLARATLRLPWLDVLDSLEDLPSVSS